MSILPEIAARRSVRSWDAARGVPEEALQRVLEAGRLAPTAKNNQDIKIVVVRDAATRAAMKDVCKGQAFVAEAPVVVAVCAGNVGYKMTCGLHAYGVDGTIVADHMQLQAQREGLGTCWIGAFYEDKMRELLRVPDTHHVVTVFPLGYPSEAALAQPRKPRKPLSQFVTNDHW